MTGLELLKQEMINRGCNKAQCDSKAVLVVLDIVSKADGKYLLLAELESAIKSKRLEITCLQDQIEELKIDKQKAKKEYEEMEQLRYNRKMKKLQETDDYIKQFFEALEQAETPEARDRLRVAQVFIQSSAEYPPLLSEAKVGDECQLFLLKLFTISKIYAIIDT